MSRIEPAVDFERSILPLLTERATFRKDEPDATEVVPPFRNERRLFFRLAELFGERRESAERKAWRGRRIDQR